MPVTADQSNTLSYVQGNSWTHVPSWQQAVFGGTSVFLLFAFVLSLFVQIEVLSIGSRSLVGYHILLAFITMAVLTDRVVKQNFWATPIEVLFYSFLISLILPTMLSWSIGLSMTLLVFAGLAFLIGLRFGKYPEEHRRKIYQVVMFCFVAAIVMRAAIHIGELGLVYSRARGCEGCFLATGGRNIEVTMFSILALLYRGRYRISIGLLLTVTAVLFQSRVGILGAMSFWLLYMREVGVSFMFLAFLAAVQTMLVTVFLGFDGGALSRFELSSELELMNKGVGRLALWAAALESIPTLPFGIGPGNSVNYINNELMRTFWENNIHNAFLTWILELGWVHGTVVILLVLRVLFQAMFRISALEAPATIFLILTSLLQFTGYDAVFWFMIAVFLSARRTEAIAQCEKTESPHAT
jgi:hypothetical protein